MALSGALTRKEAGNKMPLQCHYNVPARPVVGVWVPADQLLLVIFASTALSLALSAYDAAKRPGMQP